MALNRSELVSAIAAKSGLTKTDADAALSALQDVLVEQLSAGEAVKITGLLSVERVERKARTGRNPAPVKRSKSQPVTVSRFQRAPF